jgi:hypothetical protein
MLKHTLYAIGLYKVRWDREFPHARDGDEPTLGIRRVAEQGQCQVCRRVTSWRNTVTDTWVCSLRCRMKALRELKQRPQEILMNELLRIEKGDP